MPKPLNYNEVLKTWDSLNKVIRGASEEDCMSLMKQELDGQRRPQFVLRIFSRFNRVRAARERAELSRKLGGAK